MLMQKMTAVGFKLAHPLIIANDVNIQDMLNSGNASNAGLAEFQQQAENIGGGIYSVGMRVMIFAIAIAAMVAFVAMVLKGGDANARAEQKQSIPWRAIGIVGFFAVPGILALLQAVGGNLFG